MELKAWLKNRGMTQREFAAKVGITEAAFSQLLKGHFMPSLALAGRIEQATDGDVPMSSWLR